MKYYAITEEGIKYHNQLRRSHSHLEQKTDDLLWLLFLLLYYKNPPNAVAEERLALLYSANSRIDFHEVLEVGLSWGLIKELSTTEITIARLQGKL